MSSMKRKLSDPPETDRFLKLPKPDISTSASLTAFKHDPALLLSYDRPHTSPVHWNTFRKIVIFGDSYSSNAETNWVGHLCKRMPSGPCPAVLNFARGGDTVEDDLASQLELFLRNSPIACSVEESNQALFVFWMGINDCGRTDADELETIVERIFDTMHDLYVKWKARSFLLINVPPMQRSPGGKDMCIDAERYDTWNFELLRQAEDFAKTASNASVFVVSSHSIISEILDHPARYGLLDCIDQEEDADEAVSDDSDDAVEGAIWEDDIHLSEAAHQVFADRLWGIFGEP
ncbi:SGNH hydrolase-type esterase domain-containing protein [Lyophyllum atratum]|nr:SGNH hydrolase-type esterase domain-containing protein [Lyophyllum atratum]